MTYKFDVTQIDFEDQSLASAANGGVLLQGEVEYIDVVNYALYSSGRPILRQIRLTNCLPRVLTNVQMEIRSDNGLCLPFSQRFDALPNGEVCQIDDVPLSIDGDVLAGITERIRCTLTLSLKPEGAKEIVQSFQITLLPFDHWQGYGYYPELIAAFEMPNHPDLAPIIADAAAQLESWTGDPSAVAYFRDADRVLQQASAIYTAIQKRNIVYNVAPPSFEMVGQRVRLCDAVLREQMGNCIELTLLYCACLEAVGLHPLIILIRGHAFAGVWLEEKYFAEAAMDDKSLLEKHMSSGIDEIALVECTMMTAGGSPTFDDARRAAEKHLTNGTPFHYIIDVHRARLAGVAPMPMRVQTPEGFRLVRPELDVSATLPGSLGRKVDMDGLEKAALDKQAMWERKLLDLSLRNGLINMRMNRSAVPLLAPSCEELDAALHRYTELTVGARPDEFQPEPCEDSFDELLDHAAVDAILRSDISHGSLRSALTASALEKALKALYRAAKLSRDENGVNTLYVAVGLLRWAEAASKTKFHHAPIVLIPAELVRKPAGRGYALRLRDEAPMVNVTLLEKLKQEHQIEVPGLEPLPLDEQGNVDYRKVFAILHASVMEDRGWKVLEACHLANFAFGQFAMWNDLRIRAAMLPENRITASLLKGHLTWDATPLPSEDDVRDDDLLLPLPADASQIRAVRAAMQGDTFVLHGPPGTGKSQTITNIIANLLAQGKRVLFVAEKMAALEVVQRRLEGVGLGAFCLELHSNRGTTQAVLDQLHRSLELEAQGSGGTYAQKRIQIERLRGELDAHARALHKVRHCGESLYTILERYEQFARAKLIAPLSEEFLAALNPEALDRCTSLIGQLTAAGRAVGHPCNHPLQRVREANYSRELRVSLQRQLEEYKDALTALRQALGGMASAIERPAPATRNHQAELLLIASDLRFWSNPVQRAWAQTPELSSKLTRLLDAANHFINAATARKTLLETWNEGFLELDGSELKAELKKHSGGNALLSSLGMHGLVRRVRPYAKQMPNAELLWAHFNALQSYQAELHAAKASLIEAHMLLSALYPDVDPAEADWAQVQELARASLNQLNATKVISDLARLRTAYIQSDAALENAETLTRVWQDVSVKRRALESSVNLSEADSESLDAPIPLCEALLKHLSELREWAVWLARSQEAREAGLGALVDAYEKGLDHDGVLPAFYRALYMGLAEREISADEALRTFAGPVFSETVRQFRELDLQLRKLSQEECFCRLAARRATSGQLNPVDPEYVALNREFNRNGKGKSIRALFEGSPHLMQALCPCMLMSPVSIAQYLPDCVEDFDVVIFDEASQLQTCKAVGALSRAKSAVIVGDPRQMPPTTFFASNVTDEESLDIDDLDSVLDDCLALNVPQAYLLWHYRSHHESLISFSNEQFYESKLLTFPSANDRESKLRSVFVENGVFERNGARHNRAEAAAVVEELKRRAHDEELCKLSVGIVTFNLPQRNLIDDMLSAACRDDAELEKWINEGDEPLFIKNLENVQGDERDVILFSVSYGPDAEGNVYMNFGPLNRDGGWRRLNVAVTRAREEMVVFTTLRPEQINLSRTSAKGVAGLRAFLDYAQRRTLSLSEYNRNSETDGIADTLARMLAERGWDVARGVGRSRCRVDVAVIDPDDPGNYVLGILLDGALYGRRGQTTRDREAASADNLVNLGWRIHRVYALDWWDDRRREVDRIVSILEELRPRKDPEPEAESADDCAAEPAAEAEEIKD